MALVACTPSPIARHARRPRHPRLHRRRRLELRRLPRTPTDPRLPGPQLSAMSRPGPPPSRTKHSAPSLLRDTTWSSRMDLSSRTPPSGSRPSTPRRSSSSRPGRAPTGNVAPLIFRLEEASYLAGMIAGGLTRSNILGFVGGIELPPIKAAYEGWVNGAKAVNPKIRSREIYLNSFDDAAAGREAALALDRAGADMFHHNADAAALGVFQAARERSPVSRLRRECSINRRSRRNGFWEARSSTCPVPCCWSRGRSKQGSSRQGWRRSG